MMPRAVAATVGAACLTVVAVLTAVAVIGDGPTSLDVSVSTWVAAHRSADLIWIMERVTHAGSWRATLLVAAAGCAWGLRRRDWKPLLFVVPTTIVASTTTNLMKLAVARPRPDGDIALHDFSGYSFPSGHATTAAALWGAVAVVLVRWGRISPRLGVALWAVATALVGLSRIVLGAHWLTDVVAGAALGTACVAAAFLIIEPAGPADADDPGSDQEPDADPQLEPGRRAGSIPTGPSSGRATRALDDLAGDRPPGPRSA